LLIFRSAAFFNVCRVEGEYRTMVDEGNNGLLLLEIWERRVQTRHFNNIRKSFQKDLIAWFSTAQRDLPWRKTHDPYKIMVSELMLQQTQVDRVVDFYEKFINTLPTFETVANADESLLLELWGGLGYYNRVRNLQKTAKIILGQYHGNFPTTKEEILKLPGIGEYTAGAIMSFALNQREPIVDTNVDRVYSRVFLSEKQLSSAPKSVREKIMWLLSDALTPYENFWDYNQGIMDFGAIHCKNDKPLCNTCPFQDFCKYYQDHSLTRFF